MASKKIPARFEVKEISSTMEDVRTYIDPVMVNKVMSIERTESVPLYREQMIMAYTTSQVIFSIIGTKFKVSRVDADNQAAAAVKALQDPQWILKFINYTDTDDIIFPCWMECDCYENTNWDRLVQGTQPVFNIERIDDLIYEDQGNHDSVLGPYKFIRKSDEIRAYALILRNTLIEMEYFILINFHNRHMESHEYHELVVGFIVSGYLITIAYADAQFLYNKGDRISFQLIKAVLAAMTTGSHTDILHVWRYGMHGERHVSVNARRKIITMIQNGIMQGKEPIDNARGPFASYSA